MKRTTVFLALAGLALITGAFVQLANFRCQRRNKFLKQCVLESGHDGNHQYY